ncbi:peroxisomal ATPase PEX1 [Neocloeon triangulifer]|uniref:peroxisomal ATPase PEX1 n=1 Tax=Neocloeon triangulifer TaxID=2078957 RepID=UPI00286F0B28|nr:peroxisomal ATPase PEX1 [Neocloeon triangulifer]
MERNKKRLMRVKFVSSKDCFLHVNSTILNSMQGKIFEVLDENGKTCLGFSSCFTSSLNSLKDDEVGISQKFAKALHALNNSIVSLREFDQLIPKSSQVIFTTSDADYSILAMNASTVEYVLLDQTRVMKKGQSVAIWISPMITINLTADKIVPESTIAFLTNETEVHVLPASDASPISSEKSFAHQQTTNDQQKNLICRVIFSEKPHPSPFVAKIHPCARPNFLFALGKILSVDLSLTLQLFADPDIYPSHDFLSNLPILYLDKRVRGQCKVFDGCKIYIEPLEIVRNSEFIVQTSEIVTTEEVKNCMKSLADTLNRELLIVNQAVFGLKDKLSAKFELKTPFTILSSTSLETCNIAVAPEMMQIKPEIHIEKRKQEEMLNFSSWSPLFHKLKESLLANTKTHSRAPLVVLKGKPGCGVGEFLHQFIRQMSSAPMKMHDLALDCKAFKGKTMDTLKSKLSDLFVEAAKHDPCIVIFENIDQFFPPQASELNESPDSSYRLGVIQFIWNMSHSFSARHGCFVITTVSDQDVKIWDDKTIPVDVFCVPDLTLEDKVQLLRQCLQKLDADWTEDLKASCSQILEICSYQDVCDIAVRAVFEKLKSIAGGARYSLTTLDLSSARNYLTSQSLKEFNLLRIEDSNNSADGFDRWSKVGGLIGVKEKLTEMIFWPFNFPHLFMSNPLKLQKGALLYGMPGTGKTLIAVELAKSSGMNLIHIKGPELLNKFIGASEEAVRNLFYKASAAKPCILFFDEIDSLAPRRGRDTTGVSDRVVNQLLTSLDGVDSPVEAGVWVLAASSRPDLIDRALLRPGRFDTMLYCNLPTLDERREILRILSSGLEISCDTNLNKLAEMTDGFCGADIQALLQTAQLAALEEFVDVFSNEMCNKVEEQEFIVSWKHMTHALEKTRPSLTKKERTRYELIYREYEQSMKPIGRGKRAPIKQRTVLA